MPNVLQTEDAAGEARGVLWDCALPPQLLRVLLFFWAVFGARLAAEGSRELRGWSLARLQPLVAPTRLDSTGRGRQMLRYFSDANTCSLLLHSLADCEERSTVLKLPVAAVDGPADSVHVTSP